MAAYVRYERGALSGWRDSRSRDRRRWGSPKKAARFARVNITINSHTV
jgi:hypothetical protein